MPNVSNYRPTVKFVLLLAALALLILMVARPQMGSKISHDKRQGIETIICLDISNSMSGRGCGSFATRQEQDAGGEPGRQLHQRQDRSHRLCWRCLRASCRSPATMCLPRCSCRTLHQPLSRPRAPTIGCKPSTWPPRASPSRTMWAAPSSSLPMARTMSREHRRQRRRQQERHQCLYPGYQEAPGSPHPYGRRLLSQGQCGQHRNDCPELSRCASELGSGWQRTVYSCRQYQRCGSKHRTMTLQIAERRCNERHLQRL